MIKKAVVEIGKTPSVLSGKPCTMQDSSGEAIANNEVLKKYGNAKVAMKKIVKGKLK